MSAAVPDKTPYQPATGATVLLLDIGCLLEHPDNPRGAVRPEDCEELAASVIAAGCILEPLLVVPFRDAYRIVAGARRRMAGKLAGFTQVPCIVCDMTESQQLDAMLIENLQRKDLTYLQTARAFLRMVNEDNATQQDIVRRIGCSTSFVSNLLNLAVLAPPVQELIDSGRLPLSMAPVLARITDPNQQKEIASLALQKRMSVGALKTAIGDLLDAIALAEETDTLRRPQRRSPRRVLGSDDVFTRTQALAELDGQGVATFDQLAAAFDDVCLGTCVEHKVMEMCEACPVPRFIMSVLRRVRLSALHSSAQLETVVQNSSVQSSPVLNSLVDGDRLAS